MCCWDLSRWTTAGAGLTFILILYMARGSRGGLAAAYLAYALFWGSTSSQVNSLFGYPLTFLTWDGLGPVLAAFFRLQGMIWLSLPLILCPTRTGLRLPGRLGYWLYPIHLVVLILIRLMTGTGSTSWSEAFDCFHIFLICIERTGLG